MHPRTAGMFDLKYYYTMKKKECVLSLIDELRNMDKSSMLAHLDMVKNVCLATTRSVHCLPSERVFFRDMFLMTSNHYDMISDSKLLRKLRPQD